MNSRSKSPSPSPSPSPSQSQSESESLQWQRQLHASCQYNFDSSISDWPNGFLIKAAATLQAAAVNVDFLAAPTPMPILNATRRIYANETKTVKEKKKQKQKRKHCVTASAFGFSQSPSAASRDLRAGHAKCVYTLSPFCQFDLFVCR